MSKHGVNAPKSDGECSEASCELIRMLPVLLKERVRSPQGMERHPGSVPKMIEIRCGRRSWSSLTTDAWKLTTGSEQEKGIRWMPWHQEAMKDVARCEKPWGAASRL